MEIRRNDIAILESSKKEASSAIERKNREAVKTGGKVELRCSSIIRRCLIEEYDLTIEQLAQLGQTTIPAKIHDRSGTLVRIFAPASCQAKGITIKDFESLNKHPILILYDGYYYKSGGPGLIFIEKREERMGAGLSLLELEMRNGKITEIGGREDASGVVRWVGSVGAFYMYGGWIAVFLLVILIIGVTSALIT